jgi:hypothetical protein
MSPVAMGSFWVSGPPDDCPCTVGEIILAWIAREVRKGEHHDGEMRGFGPRCWCIRGDGRRSVRPTKRPQSR